MSARASWALVSLVLLASACSSRQPPPSASTPPVTPIADTVRPKANPGLHFHSPLLERAHRIMADRSASYAEAAAFLENQREVRIEVGHRDDFPVGAAGISGGVAYVAPVFDSTRSLAGMRIIVDTGHLESAALHSGYPMDRLLGDLGIIIAHELYGHVRPMFPADGRPMWPGPCSDTPRNGEPACAIARENHIRAEVGLPLRSGHEDLALGFLCAALPGTCR
jgi:hypothetical protein